MNEDNRSMPWLNGRTTAVLLLTAGICLLPGFAKQAFLKSGPKTEEAQAAGAISSAAMPASLKPETPKLAPPDPERPLRAMEQTPDAGRNAQAFAIGDRLKIVAFEKLTKIAPDRVSLTSERPGNRIERPDLSGELLVQEDGRVCPAILECIPAIGRSQRHLEQLLAAAYSDSLDHALEVSVTVVEREPIYVLGAVTRPGTYKYSPALTVSHAIALSGGFEGESVEASRAAELLREDERRSRAMDRLKDLLARQGALAGDAQAGAAALARLRELWPQAEIDVVLAEARQLRMLITQRRDHELAELDQSSAGAARELAVMKDKMRVLNQSKKDREERLSAINTLQKQGMQRTYQALSARGEVSDIEERRLELGAAILATEMRIHNFQQAQRKLRINADIEERRELTQLRNDIAAEEAAISSARKLMKTVLGPAREAPGPVRYRLEVTRRTAAGPQEIVADGLFVLRPGDLLRVRPRNGAAG